jgi:hypothetical protein
MPTLSRDGGLPLVSCQQVLIIFSIQKWRPHHAVMSWDSFDMKVGTALVQLIYGFMALLGVKNL